MRSGLFTARFWIQAADRAIKSFAAGVLAAIGISQSGDVVVGQNNAFKLDWHSAGGLGLFLAIVSVLMSVTSSTIGDSDSPMALPLPEPPANQDDGPPAP